MTDLFDSVIDSTDADRPAFRQAPVGDYLAVVKSAKRIKANTGTEGIELTFTLREPMFDGDFEGVELAKCRCKDTQYVTDKTAKFVKERLTRITEEVKGQTFAEALETLPGNDVVIEVGHETENRDGTKLDTPRLVVKKYFSVGWYTEKKRAA